MRSSYLSKRRLEELDRILPERDKAVLRSLEQCRYLSTGQIQRLHYTDSKTTTSGLRLANMGTAKLRSYGLIDMLERRIGGVRAGSKAYVWSLTESGVHLLNLHNTKYTPRKRAFEPSLNFLKHTLEVAEIYVQLTEICKRNNLGLVNIEMEPVCWRGYTGEDGTPATMKPDMFAVTSGGDYEDSWFIEVDMNTESPSKVVDKCRRYTRYYKSGIEQKQHGVFPLVVWIVYSQSRKDKLRQYISECRDITEQNKGIFMIIMPDEFEPLIVGGVEAITERKGGKAS